MEKNQPSIIPHEIYEFALTKAMDSLVAMNTKLLETVSVLQKQLEDASLRNVSLFPIMFERMAEMIKQFCQEKQNPEDQPLKVTADLGSRGSK